MFRPHLGLLALCMSAAAIPAQANDQDKEKGGPLPAVFQSVLDCKGQTDPATRLACYDRAVAAMDAARSANDLVVTDRATVREAKKGLFGLALPSLKLFGDSKDEEVTEIQSTVTEVRSAKDGMPVFLLTDGSRWQQIDGYGRPAPKVGTTIRIRRASFGSFLANANGGPAFRVKRETASIF
ncbi:MAG: hypothetical protein RL519_1791 [Pseudomonadota bacterium]|jgi:hypothetical protein